MNNILSRGLTQIEFVDQYGESRVIHRNKGSALRVKKRQDSISHVLNRVAASLIGERIRARRLAAGLTLDGLLVKAGLSAGAAQGKNRMYEIENAGKNRSGANAQGIRFGTLYAIAIALECEPTDLLPATKEIAERAGVALMVPNDVRLIAA